MNSFLLVLVTFSCWALAQSDGIVHKKIEKLKYKEEIGIQLAETGNYFYMNISIGNPPQEVKALVDTGSADVYVKTWFFNVNESLTAETYKGPYSYSQSFGGGDVFGSYFNDTIRVGEFQLDDYFMGLVKRSTEIAGGPPALLGLGLPAVETGISQFYYDNFLIRLAKSKQINSASFLFWFNNENYGSTGDMIFGGIDLAKIEGEITKAPINDTVITGESVGKRHLIASFDSISTSNHAERILSKLGYLIDMGSTSGSLEPEIWQAVGAAFNLTEYQYTIADDTQSVWSYKCGTVDLTQTINFQWGSKLVKSKLENHQVSEKWYNDNFGLSVDGVNPHDVSDLETCILALSKGHNGSFNILGTFFMRDLYLGVDTENFEFLIADYKETDDSRIVPYY